MVKEKTKKSSSSSETDSNLGKNPSTDIASLNHLTFKGKKNKGSLKPNEYARYFNLFVLTSYIIADVRK